MDLLLPHSREQGYRPIIRSIPLKIDDAVYLQPGLTRLTRQHLATTSVLNTKT